jgi:hypothetical protein
MAGSFIDIDTPGKYPVVLSDALLGKTSKETYTAVRCPSSPSSIECHAYTLTDNHKASPSSDSSSVSSQLQPADSDPGRFDLSISDGSDEYVYNGVRVSGDGKYVLIFDPAKKHFVLHRIDSTFNMNMVSSPWEQDPATLRSQYTQLESGSKSQTEAPPKKVVKAKNPPAPKAEPKKRKAAPAKKPKAPVREPTPEEDSDDGLTIEYPDAPGTKSGYKPASVFERHVSEDISDEDEDAEGEDYESERNQDVDHLQLPSPANNNAGGISDEDLEQDLEAELEQALANDSSESEEE